VDAPGAPGELGQLFHRLNNQLGIALANAEILEENASDPRHRLQAASVVSSIVEALRASRAIRHRAEIPGS
jgi:hypothetical protein